MVMVVQYCSQVLPGNWGMSSAILVLFRWVESLLLLLLQPDLAQKPLASERSGEVVVVTMAAEKITTFSLQTARTCW